MIEEVKNTPPPVVENNIELPYIPQISEKDFEEACLQIKHLRGQQSDNLDQFAKI